MTDETDISAERVFKNRAAVLKYLHDSGDKISKTDLYRKCHPGGELRPRSDRKYHIKDVEEFLAKRQLSDGAGKKRLEDFAYIQQTKQERQSEIFKQKHVELLIKNGRSLNRLLLAEEVRTVAFSMSRSVRDSLLTFPARISPILAAEFDQIKIEEIVTREISQILKELSEWKMLNSTEKS